MDDQNPNERNPYGGYSAPPPYERQQPPHGQTQPPYSTQYGNGNVGETSMGLTESRAILLGYAFWWVTGLIVFFTEKKNSLVRVHAMQSILLFGGASILLFVLNQLYWVAPFGLDQLVSLAINLVWLAAGALWIFLLFNSWQGNYVKLPYVGDYAEKLVK